MTGPKVILADDDALARDILRNACEAREVSVVAEAATIADLRDAAERFPAAVVVSSNTLEDVSVDATSAGLGDERRAIVLASDGSPDRMRSLLSQPFRGYLLYDASPNEVVDGVMAVARGAVVLAPTAAAMVLDQWREMQRDGSSPMEWRGRPLLTPREAEVLAALAEGMSTKAIARELNMAAKTVENHKLRIFDKLGVHTQAQAVIVALRHGLAPEPATTPEP
ncbi:MAG: hypothetical protein QOI47_2652 [Actinomycetota bacterium]|nr:hypothetical protein [Actinomycetota bacterium]